MQGLTFTLILFFLSITTFCSSQNLVLNPSFEEYDSCANYGGGVNVINYWNEINYLGTPDYYNQCAIIGEYNSPSTFFGHQHAFKGIEYVGLVLWTTNPVPEREMICGRLTNSLSPTTIYCISLYINLPDSAEYAINRIGCLLSDSAFDIAVGPPNWMLDFEPSIESDSNVFLNDTATWVKIEGTYTSQGGESYILISNFRTNTETNAQYLNYGNILNNQAYYFIDQVSVEEIKPANAGNNQIITAGQQVQIGNNVTEDATYQWLPATGLSDPAAPNPIAQPFTTTTYTVTKTQCSSVTTDEVTITVNTNPAIVVQGTFTLPSLCAESSSAEIFDARGRKVIAFDTTQQEDLVALAPGMYFLRFQCVNGDVSVRRLVVQE
jgi:hypothetical protein